MKTISLLLLYLFLTVCSHSQPTDTDRYYPENPLYRKLGVKSILDTSASPSGHHYTEEFDSLGRRTAWYYVEDSVRTYFKYEKKADTLIRLHFYTVKEREKPVYQFEKFHYNAKGKIEFYASCGKNYGTDSATSECEMRKFYYGEKGQLLAELDYSETNYQIPFSVNISPVDTLMKLVNVSHYFYDKATKVIAKKQVIGPRENRAIDSFFYDKSNRLIKTTSFQKQGFVGDIPYADLRSFELIRYREHKTEITSFDTYLNWEHTKPDTSEVETSEYIYEPNGLLKIWFHQSGSRTKSMLTYNVYEFYDTKAKHAPPP
jgi:hypothetical protein